MRASRKPTPQSGPDGARPEIARETARMALTCQVRLMAPGVVERIVGGDETVCTATNPLAFDRLRQLLTTHFVARAKA